MRLPVLLLLLAALATGSVAGAANLVENPGFDDDVDGWVEVVDTELEWSPVDELGSLLSGSMKVTVPDLDGDHNLGVLCVPVVAGTTYAFGIDARIPSGQDLVNPSVFARLSWSTGLACNPSTPAAIGSSIELQGDWGNSQGWATAPPGTMSAAIVLRIVVEGNPGPAVVEFDNAFFLEDSTCGVTPTAHCLNEGRFRVVVEWETKQGEVGFGRAVPLTDDSGYFWFFNEENVELVTKLLDACPTQFNAFWFFAAGLTDVETVIRVHDTGTDTAQVYMNPQETPFAPIQDTDAFETCP